MNCNTTHYRANSSSVPGDPTHSDRLEAEEYKQAISERRAEAVRNYLASWGAAGENIRLVGFGASISLTACAQRERALLVSCLAPDRRVTVEVVPPPM